MAPAFVPLCFFVVLLYGRRTRDDTLQFDIEGPVIRFDTPADRNVPWVCREPDRKLALLVVDQSFGSKQFRIDSKRINAADHGLHSFLLEHLHRNRIDASAVADVDVKALADFEWLRANEVDRRQDVLQLS